MKTQMKEETQTVVAEVEVESLVKDGKSTTEYVTAALVILTLIISSTFSGLSGEEAAAVAKLVLMVLVQVFYGAGRAYVKGKALQNHDAKVSNIVSGVIESTMSDQPNR